ncbi:MAG: penicillin-binding protein 2 [Armatimonadota bacterium]|nr:penicillin-binding protein 2 [Armatimonadota bacterium]
MSAHPNSLGRGNVTPGHNSVLTGTQRRIEGTFYLILVPLLLLAARLVWLQVLPVPKPNVTAASQTFERHQTFYPRRADILAADGTALAVTLDEYDVCANPRAVADKAKMVRLIASAIGGDASQYLRLLHKTTHSKGKPNYFVRLARRVGETRIARLRKLMGPQGDQENRKQRALRKKLWEPITLRAAPRRHYPLGNVASQLIGFTSREGQGVDGLERAWNTDLAGIPGDVVSQVDARGRPVPGFVTEYRPAVAGRAIVTTIDPEIQADTDLAIKRTWQQYKPNFITAIVMRPQTGEIVAMSTAPTFDLNRRPKNIVDLATNRCINFAYEPGSTFKIITAAAAVEELPDWRRHSFYCNGTQRVGKHLMHCWVCTTSKRRHGDEDLSESIRDSCNFGVYGFARKVGAPTMLQYARRFGLGTRVGLAGLREHPGLLPRNNPRQWSQEQLANFAFGQGMLMSPLQLVRVAATIANDGVMMKPLLVKELRDEQGEVLKVFRPQVERRVIRPQTAHTVRAMMERVTREGTARQFVFVPGYATAGKTGSAQKAEGRHGYAAGKFISSFVGFVPSGKPEFVILIMADEPHGSHWGSEVCGPPFSEIATKAMLHLRLRKGTSAPAPILALMTRPKKKN